ncbi:hypothetical protein [Plebeiibacterium sediminum]|uniref:Peptidase S74 domain-containing protein n=1 Tax=Plebeiibacterium sediminum TaxID=2992112 RepID=A0AAE3M8J3_9BACT|nr:hypothetical protein [Plebeiobacterium sediminum]MCW3789221.1 hypothetical protein [Plebeiobacterium sediminum]
MKDIILLVVTLFSISLVGYTQTNIKDETGNTTPIYIKGGKVGVGTDSPGEKLDIYGKLRTINYSVSSATWDNITMWSTGSESYIQSNGDENGLFIKSNTGNKIIFESNVGIGIESPLTKLHVNNGNSGFNASNVSGLFVENNGSANNYFVFQTATIGGGKSFSITNSGLVGIGLSNPDSKLHLKDGNIKLSNSGNTSYGIVFEHDYPNYPTSVAQILFDFYGHSYGGAVVKHGMIYQSGRKGLSKHWFIDSSGKTQMMIDNNGNVGIGNTSPNAKLEVAGTIRATEIKVEAQTADFVFADNYRLMNLTDVEAYIKEHQHLPEIPSASDMEASGVNLAEMNKLLLQKIEELTLYTIQQDEKLVKIEGTKKVERLEREKLKKELETQKQLVKEQEERLAKIETLILGNASAN